jgi:hypothetical protein
MNKNIKKHLLLRILATQYVKHWNDIETGRKNNYEIGFSESYLKDKAKLDQYQLRLLVADLVDAKKIQFYRPNDNDFYGWACTDKGVSSFNNKEYKKLYYNSFWSTCKNWIQTIIPVLSLVITIVVVLNNQDHKEKEIQELTTKIIHIEKQVSTILDSTKTEYQNQFDSINISKNDSLQ